ncbi:DEAD/DEAH box helicase family protein [Tissierella creatinophila]|uniref:Type III restriction enzyme, res subunit n=1 Tax=Tissierella creatinophila DSM 6911 TaxID=1123403 RepID=A0A1U7M3Y8_TISCR|nr:DEAD/DEAH box helicase family protein [Tissierella creatinophila]OLS01960.1 type III restriction enzyme, res subunit [Tissierella creatinophila DSM 6911]
MACTIKCDLEQTIRTLSNVDHPYRQKIDMDFSGRVEVLAKEQLLNGQGFNLTSVKEQLIICVFRFDSIRSNKKDGRKVYQQNSQLAQFEPYFENLETLIEDVDNTALIQVLNQLSPVVVVDESHNAQSDLSVEMLNNLNPSFVLDLTATPKANSNIISYVDARELKKENMVKLPVVVYNRNSKQEVVIDAIQLRGNLEKQAIEEEQRTGKYICPIVLFQAQPKGREDNATFEKLKEELIGHGIPNEQIAIKTSNVNEIKGIDLMSKDCEIRYIITVNALKEG